MREKKVTFERELYDRMWKTRGARFIAYHRNRKTQQLSFYSISFLSAYLVVLNLLPAFKILPTFLSLDQISFVSAALSIVLLVYTIIESSMAYGVNAEKFHNCAKEIGALHAKLDRLLDRKRVSETEVQAISDEYDAILKRYENHDPIDYAFHKASNREEFRMNRIMASWIRFKWNYLIHARHYLVFSCMPIGLILAYL